MENNYQLSRIQNYIAGLMNKEEMHAFENEALNDPFLQDALDGYKLQNGVDVKQISLLQRRLADRVEERNAQKNARYFTWQRLTIGTTAAVMFLTVSALMLIRYLPSKNSVKVTQVEVMQEETYALTISNYDVNKPPTGGWKLFEETLNTKLAADFSEEVVIPVEVIYSKEGFPKKIQLNTKDLVHPSNKAAIIDFLDRNSWPIGTTNFTITVSKVKAY